MAASPPGVGVSGPGCSTSPSQQCKSPSPPHSGQGSPPVNPLPWQSGQRIGLTLPDLCRYLHRRGPPSPRRTARPAPPAPRPAGGEPAGRACCLTFHPASVGLPLVREQRALRIVPPASLI